MTSPGRGAGGGFGEGRRSGEEGAAIFAQVTVNTIMPGSTLTEGVETMLKTMYQESDLPESMWEEDFMKKHRPLSQIQRLIRPEEIGRFVAFVASPYASSFSGAALRLDGGLVPTIY